MKLKTATYASQKDVWPSAGRHILAQFDDESIIVYQAYNPSIARAAVESQNFHSAECAASGFSMNRMTWIKTNFLWMMFRSGWATKANQERILALRLSRSGFEHILSKAVSVKSPDDPNNKPSKNDEVRLQWDPDHYPNGDKVENRRAVQLGLRGNMVERMSREFILSIEDVTDFVIQNRQFINDPQSLIIPLETVYPISDQLLAKNINIS